MNIVNATISSIVSEEKVTLVGFSVGQEQLEMVSLGISEQLVLGSRVRLGIKATNIALSQQKLHDVSITNQVETIITALEMGSLLCLVHFSFEGVAWESVITQKSAVEMQLRVGEKVFVLIKSSDLSIVEAL